MSEMRLFRRRMEWGLELSGFGRPFGIGFDPQGRLLVTDMDCHVVVRFDVECETFQCHEGLGEEWSNTVPLLIGHSSGRPKRAPNGWNGPHSVVADLSGRLLVTCYYKPMVVALHSDGKTNVLIGGDSLTGPATAQFDRQGHLLVAEYAQNLILAFSLAGAYLGRLGRSMQGDLLKFDPGCGGVPASTLLGGFDRPHLAKVLSDDSIIVADTWNNRLQRFTSKGEFMACLDNSAGWKSDLPNWTKEGGGDIACPVAVDEDAYGRLLVTLWGSNRLMLFEPNGRRLPLNCALRLKQPYDARFYHDGVVVADTNNGRVLILDRISDNCS